MPGQLKERSFAMTGAADQQLIGPLDFLQIFSSAADVSLSFDGGAFQTARQGSRFADMPQVNRVDIVSGTAQTVIIKYSLGGVYSEQSAQIEIDPDTPTLPTLEEQNAGGVALADFTCTAGAAVTVIPGNAARREITLKNLDDNVNTMRVVVGGGTAAITTGHEIAPGDTFTTKNTGAISVFNTNDATGGDEDISRVQESLT